MNVAEPPTWEDTWTFVATAAAIFPSPTIPAAIATVQSARAYKQAKWLEARLERLLPTRYFHLVVTLPHELNPLARFNQKLVFNLLFEAASRALLQFSRNYERLRAQVGFTAVLHNWDQELYSHPHLHLVVTGGGLSEDGERWIAASNSFLLPVRALSKIIRA